MAVGPKIVWNSALGHGGGPKPTISVDDAGAGLADDAGAGLADDAGAGPPDRSGDEGNGATPDRAATDPGVAQPPSATAMATIPPATVRARVMVVGRPIRPDGSARRKVKRCLSLLSVRARPGRPPVRRPAPRL